MVSTGNLIEPPGQYYDAEPGLHYNYFRDHDPTAGRYIESDPIGLVGGISTYGYVGGNPLTHADSLGLLVVHSTCSEKTKRRIEEVERRIREKLDHCIACPEDDPDLKDKIRDRLDTLGVECINSHYIEGVPACARFDSFEWEIELSIDGLTGKYGCNCLENTILHEVIHAAGYIPEEFPDKVADRCFPCR